MYVQCRCPCEFHGNSNKIFRSEIVDLTPNLPVFSPRSREPVSVEEAEDYFDIISSPMDFQTMQAKFSKGQYRHAQDFLEDVKLVFSNAEEYNQPGSSVLSCMAKTEQSFTQLLHKLLPGLGYLRRRQRKRVSRTPQDEEEEETPKVRKMQNGKGKVGRPRKAVVEQRRKEEEESEEEGSVKRKSKRATATSSRRDYREQESDGEEGDNRRTRQRGGDGGDSDEENGASHRHSKRQKRS